MESSRTTRAAEPADEKRRSGRSVAPEAAASLEGALAAAPAPVARRGAAQPLTQRRAIALQGAVGNRAAAREIGRMVQRHAEGAELPDKGEQVAELQEKEQANPEAELQGPPQEGEAPEAEAQEPEQEAPQTEPQPAQQAAPEATRTKTEEKAQVGEAKTSGKAFQKQQKLTPGAMSLATAQKILQGAFGGLTDIVPGTIVILADQPACSAKYDEVCIADGITRPDGSAWQAGDCAKDDAAAGVQTEGFAWKGVVYVNGQTTLVTATAHEILHNNAHGGFRGLAGETFNEGTTELLARRALKAAGVKVPSVTAYPDQVKFTEQLEKVVGEKALKEAYFTNPWALAVKFEELKGTGAWDALKLLAEALDEAKFKKALAAKKAK